MTRWACYECESGLLCDMSCHLNYSPFSEAPSKCPYLPKKADWQLEEDSEEGDDDD